MFLSLSPSPQILLLPSIASNPQTSCTSPAPQGFANPLDSESLLICCQRSQQGPPFFPRCLLLPPSLPASPASSGPPHHSPQLQGLHPQLAGFSQASFPPNSLREPSPYYSTAQGSLPHPHLSGISFPFPGLQWTSSPILTPRDLVHLFKICKDPLPPPHYSGSPRPAFDFTTRDT